MKKQLAWIATCCVVYGCASTSEVIPVGKDTYTVSAEMAGNFPSWSEVKQMALKRANEYCSGIQKQMVAGKWETHGARGWSPLNAELTFQCVDKT